MAGLISPLQLRDVYHCMQFEHHLSPLSEIVLAAMERKIHADPDKIFHFEDIVKAHEYCESNQVSSRAPAEECFKDSTLDVCSMTDWRLQSCGKVVCLLD